MNTTTHMQLVVDKSDEEFARLVLICLAHLNARVLTPLTLVYDPLTIVAALAEHIGSALSILLRKGLSSADETRNVIDKMRSTAFLGKTVRASAAPGIKRGRLAKVSACSADLRESLLPFTNDHDPYVVLAALVEHVGGALFLFRETGKLATESVVGTIDHIARLAFAVPPNAARVVPPAGEGHA